MDTAATRLDLLAALNWFDVGVCAFLLIGLVVGLVRGFFAQVAGVLGVLAALLAAIELSDGAHALALERFPALASTLGRIGIFAAIFLATWLLWAILVHLGKRLLSRVEIGAFNRVLGGVLGATKGSLLAYVLLVLLLRFTPSDWPVNHEFAASHTSRGVEFVDTILKQQREHIPRPAWEVIAELRGFAAEPARTEQPRPVRFHREGGS